MSNIFLQRQPCYDPIDTSTTKFLSDIRVRKLCVFLDDFNPHTGVWWKALAPLLGLKEVCMIQAIQDSAEKQKKSPTIVILDIFFTSHTDHNVSETLKKLSNMLGRINNHDARDVVEKEITQREHIDGKPSVVGVNHSCRTVIFASRQLV